MATQKLKKHFFFTEAFYSDEFETVNILNDLLEKDLIVSNEVYGNLTLLFTEASYTEESKEILGKVIFPIDEYIIANNEAFIPSAKNIIPLNLLCDEFTKTFRSNIMWDDNVECFYVDC